MLNVHGLVVVPSEPGLKVNETTGKPGAFMNFQVVSLDDKKTPHRYPASMWVPEDELGSWREKIVAGNVFLISHARWGMRDNPDYKFPIPQLQLDRYNFKKLVEPMWAESKEEE